MKIFKNKTVKVLDNVYCDVCSNCCSVSCLNGTDETFIEYATLQADWGYSSDLDGTKYSIHLCEKCFLKIIEELRKTRDKLTSLKNHHYKKGQPDPFDGEFL